MSLLGILCRLLSLVLFSLVRGAALRAMDGGPVTEVLYTCSQAARVYNTSVPPRILVGSPALARC
jgi:hypothetical protein